MMQKIISQTLLLLFALTFSGCGNGSISGGTGGKLESNGHPLGDFKITVYEFDNDSYNPVAFAVSKNDGSFKLIQHEVKGDFWLTTGESAFTIESIGSDVEIPKEYSTPKTTPLKITWNKGEELLLNIPDLKEPK